MEIKKQLILTILTVIISITNLKAQQNEKYTINHQKEILNWLIEYNVPAVGIGIIKDGKLSECKVFGELRKGVLANDNTIFTIASLTKPVVAIVTLKLVENKQWNLDEPLVNYWYIESNKSFNYSKPVILLIDNTSFSAAENFALAMREIPHVRLVGMNTSGGFADSNWKTLPCGWTVCIPYSFFTDKNGFCWEGIGVPPDYYIKTDPKKPINDKDKLMDFAINLINKKRIK